MEARFRLNRADLVNYKVGKGGGKVKGEKSATGGGKESKLTHTLPL